MSHSTARCVLGCHKGQVHSLMGPFKGQVHSLMGPFKGQVHSLMGPFKGQVHSLMGPFRITNQHREGKSTHSWGPLEPDTAAS